MAFIIVLVEEVIAISAANFFGLLLLAVSLARNVQIVTDTHVAREQRNRLHVNTHANHARFAHATCASCANHCAEMVTHHLSLPFSGPGMPFRTSLQY